MRDKGYNNKLKILYIMKILLEKSDDRNKLTIKDIISELRKYGIEAERKSIYSDIELLQHYGIDIICTKGRENKYNIGSRNFELAELKLLVDSVQSSKFITQEKSKKLIKKLSAECSKHEAKLLNRHVYVHNRVKTMNENVLYNIDTIHNAINENKQIRFKYYSYTLDKKFAPRRNGDDYIVSPYELAWAEDNYYLIGYYTRRNDINHFRVDRMKNVEIIDTERFMMEKNKDFDLACYMSKHFDMYGGDEEQVEILFDKSLIDVVIDRFGTDVPIYKEDDNHFRVRVTIATGPTFMSWLFTFGNKAKILSPKKLVNEMKERVEMVLGMY